MYAEFEALSTAKKVVVVGCGAVGIGAAGRFGSRLTDKLIEGGISVTDKLIKGGISLYDLGLAWWRKPTQAEAASEPLADPFVRGPEAPSPVPVRNHRHPDAIFELKVARRRIRRRAAKAARKKKGRDKRAAARSGPNRKERGAFPSFTMRNPSP